MASFLVLFPLIVAYICERSKGSCMLYKLSQGKSPCLWPFVTDVEGQIVTKFPGFHTPWPRHPVQPRM